MNHSFLNEDLKQLETKGLKRSLKTIDGVQSREVLLNGRKLLNFSSNNYLGLAEDPRIRAAMIAGIEQYGAGAGASRLVCGNQRPFEILESTIAGFKNAEACLVFSSGYAANIGIISSLCRRGDMIFSDKLNHASIIDGIILSGAEFRRYPHKDMKILEEWLKEAQVFKRRFIITDSVFSMDGDLAPLDAIVALAKKYDALVMVDEAHAFGVLGKNGRGAAEYFGLEKGIDIQMGTLSKAAGVYGAYCCGSQSLIEFLVNHARSLIYTTALPPGVICASIRAVEIIQNEPARREKLWENTSFMIQELKTLGFETLETETPIIPILVGDPKTAVEFSQALFEEGLLIQAIRPPTVPQNTARLRLSVMATHSRKDLQFALQKLKTIGAELCII